ncbi:SPOR domain-containing protein [Propionivibrio sp.]|uniref:SPOR domain-containing protein n=1 Tax=Propionivibrio sp. TaxID=2212460 RepID=UPI0026043F10|nr:SPOR domain-containing protein [Propionivibrio sp.]
MRAFVFLLILINLVFLAWTQGYLGTSFEPDAFRVQQQLLADQIKVVARDEAPAETAKPEVVKTEEKKAPELCLALGDLPVADSTRIESLLAEKFPAFTTARTTIEGSANYWVYIPPLSSKQEANIKAAELKKLRVPEFFIVQETGPDNRAISLGLFSSKEAATARLEALRSQGVKSARVGERNVKPASTLLEIHGSETQADSLRKAIAEALPESRMVACKKTTAQ